MMNNTMFTTLHRFRDPKFFEENEYIYVYLPGRKLTYHIFSAYEYDNRHILHSFDSNMDLNDEHYLGAKEYVYKTIENLDNKQYLPVLFSQEFYPSFRLREDFKKASDYYLSIMIKMIEDSIENKESEDEEYNNHLEMIRNNNPSKLLEIFINASDKTLMNLDRKLLFDKISYEIITNV